MTRTAFHKYNGDIDKAGYEINFDRGFFEYRPPRPLAEIDAELEKVGKRMTRMQQEVMG